MKEIDNILTDWWCSYIFNQTLVHGNYWWLLYSSIVLQMLVQLKVRILEYHWGDEIDFLIEKRRLISLSSVILDQNEFKNKAMHLLSIVIDSEHISMPMIFLKKERT